jgi:glycosyltransferase involved in cell wall biosynthesis
MTKTIWYISKYCAISSKNSFGSRGWLLMEEFSKKGHKIVVITSQNNSYNNEYENKSYSFFFKNIKVVILKTVKYYFSKSLKRVISWFDFEFKLFRLDKKFLPNPDIIIISSLSLLTILNGIYFKKKYGCKLVFEVRDIWPLTLVELGGFSNNNPLIKLLSFIEKIGYEKSDIIVGTMPNLSEHVRKILGYNKTVYFIPMGISKDMFKNKKKEIPQYIKNHLKTDDFNIVYSGTFGMTNSLSTFFEAAKVLKAYPKIKFVIFGDGDLRKNYIKRYGYLPNLIYFSKVQKNLVQCFLSYADVLYFSAFKSKVYDYGQSANKFIDYMISGKPIIASYSGYYSMINEANCGYFIPAENVSALVNKIKELIKVPKSERNIMGARGLSWLIKNRKYEKLADDYLAFLFKN